MAAAPKAEKAPEKETQAEPVPGSEQQTAETIESQGVADESQEAPETSADDSGDGLPKGVKERTKREFEKLKEQLRTYRDAYLKTQQPKGEPAKEEELYDPQTGVVNLEALKKLQQDAQEGKRAAEDLRQNYQRDVQDREARELYQAHPGLKNPTTPEEIELFDEAERIWLHSQAYPEKYGGSQLSQREAADLATKNMKPQKATEESVEKEQASLGATGKPTQGVQSKVSSEEELERLRVGTRMGDRASMIARIKNIPKSQTEPQE